MAQIFKIVFCIGLLAIVVESQKYTTKYDNINVDALLKNTRIFNTYIRCVLDQGRCSNEGNELKRILPDALTTDCQSCSEKQKDASVKIINFIIKNQPDVWISLRAKYDPEGLYYNRLRKQIGQ